MRRRTLVAGTVVVAVAAACGPPAELRILPQAIDVSAKLGDDPNGAPTLTTKVELRCTKPEESVGWTLSDAPAWATASAVQGGTPADVDFHFHLAEMDYGENKATLVARHGEVGQNLPIRYELLGALNVGPTQSVSLRGAVGDARSSVVKLTLDSPIKPGLRWRAKTDDPWLVVEPTEGVTPATVSISGTLAKAASNASGRIEFVADSTWKGSPTVIPVVIEILNPDAIRKQIDAKLAIMTSEREELNDACKHIAAALGKPRGVDAVVQTFRDLADRAASASKRISSLQQDLLGFLEQNAAYEKVVSFDETRKAAGKEATIAVALATKLRRTVDAIEIKTMNVESRAEWQPSGIKINAGDVVAFEASGSWHLGPLAGDIGPEGLGGGRYRDVSVDHARNHGSLILRVGDAVAGGGALGLFRAAKTGGLDVRCNDEKYTDNRGTMSLRFAVIPEN